MQMLVSINIDHDVSSELRLEDIQHLKTLAQSLVPVVDDFDTLLL